jgi:anthraniloyl-CoA monooxygenase
MRISILGAGPAGLYLALLAKKADPTREVTVVERNPPDATYGWGVVFSEETLGALRDADRPSYERITESFAKWGAVDIRYRGETVRSRGHAFSGMARKELLRILQERCADLGVELRFRHEVAGLEQLPEGDLIVGADGVNSLVRRLDEESFGPAFHVHGTKYVWFGTDLVFKAFTFVFRENDHGLFQVHAYPFDAATSTFIVECPEETWRAAGLDEATEADSIAYCEKLFAEDLGGHSLMSNRSLWASFVTLRNQSWHRGKVVLLGDAAHTAHFTIGSGTKLAMEDSVALAEALARRPGDLEAALTEFEMERQPVVERFQQAALESARYFENVRRYADFEPVQFAFNLLTRSGRITHLELTRRDPAFVVAVDSWFGASAIADGAPQGDRMIVAPPPMLAPLRLRGDIVTNRVALSPTGDDRATHGLPDESDRQQLVEAATSGVGLVLTQLVAVSPQARITPGTPGLYRHDHVDVWRETVARIHRETPARVMLRLGHAGPRGATRPRREGVDRPVQREGWPLLAASPIPYTPGSQTPTEAGPEDMLGVTGDFAAAANRAGAAGFDGLLLDFSQGYLVASFISPLTNHRGDAYGGSLEARLRFPLQVFDAVRAAWPQDRPVGVSLTATDWVRGGLGPDEAVVVARVLKERGCDLVRVLAGQTTWRSRPEYGPMFLVPFSDRVRNEAGIATMVGGGITTYDQVDTILAAGRADLCVLDVPAN